MSHFGIRHMYVMVEMPSAVLAPAPLVRPLVD